jgi:hypothetical protein
MLDPFLGDVRAKGNSLKRLLFTEPLEPVRTAAKIHFTSKVFLPNSMAWQACVLRTQCLGFGNGIGK